MIAIPRMSKVDYEPVYMRGGWDLSTPTLQLYPGALRDVQNFEMTATVAGGYQRIAGYERFNGEPSPSASSFSFIQVASFVNVPSVGQTLTGGTSSATGIILAVTGTYIIVTKQTLSFINTEALFVGATPIGNATPTTIALSPKLSAQYLQLAADLYRIDILQVPGSGPIRGVVAHIIGGQDIVYAFRDNAGGTACDLYKSTVAGWVQVPFFHEVSFTVGAVATPADGATLTQGGVTATVKRVVLQAGAWTGTASGRFVITSIAGGNFGAGAATLTGGTTVTLSGIQTAIVMLPGGTFEFDIDNFYGQAITRRIYGCDGANRAFEFDGETLVPIATGATIDTPTHIKVHKLHLFLAFGSSIIISGIGTPYKWSAIDGASEHPLGDTVTNIMKQPGSATTASIGVTTSSHTVLIYGQSLSTWNVIPFDESVGGLPYTAQLMSQSYWLSSQGVVDLRSGLTFSNFRSATLTTNVQDFITSQIGGVVTSVLSKTKNQYRILFSDGTFLATTVINGKMTGITKGIYAHRMSCAWSSDSASKDERVYCGSATDGYVYQMDVGPSFDGEEIDAYLVFGWNPIKNPRIMKRFRRTSIEMQGNFYAEFSFGYQFSYGSDKVIQPPTIDYTSSFFGAPAWDTFVWDAFTWDGVTIGPSNVRTVGRAENIQYTIRSATNYIQPYIINSMMIHYSMGRGLR